LVFPGGAGAQTNVNNFSSLISLRSISFTTTGGTPNYSISGNSIFLSDPSDNNFELNAAGGNNTIALDSGKVLEISSAGGMTVDVATGASLVVNNPVIGGDAANVVVVNQASSHTGTFELGPKSDNDDADTGTLLCKVAVFAGTLFIQNPDALGQPSSATGTI